MDIRSITKTRKPGTCEACHFLIEKGAACVGVTVGPHDHPDNDRWASYRYHPGCWRVMVHFRQAHASAYAEHGPDCEEAFSLDGGVVLGALLWRSTPESRAEVVDLFDGAPPFEVQRLLWMCAWPTAEPRRPHQGELAKLLGEPHGLRAGDLWQHPDGRLLAVQARDLWHDGTLAGDARLFQLTPEPKPLPSVGTTSHRLLAAGWRIHSREAKAC